MRTGIPSRASNKTHYYIKQQRWLRYRPKPGSQRSGNQNGCPILSG